MSRIAYAELEPENKKLQRVNGKLDLVNTYLPLSERREVLSHLRLNAQGEAR